MTLTIKQRLGLDSMASSREGNLDAMMIWKDIKDKLAVSKENREKVFHLTPQGTLIDEDALCDSTVMEIAFEKEEMRQLSSLLKTYPTFRAADVDWVCDVLGQLAAELKK